MQKNSLRVNKFAWREKLADLSNFAPNAFTILQLNSSNDFFHVLAGQPIPLFKNFDESLFYFISNKFKIIGIFKGRKVSSPTNRTKYVIFENLTGYEVPVTYNANISCSQLIRQLENKNLFLTSLLISFNQNKSSYMLSIASESIDGLIENYSLQNKQQVLQLKKISSEINKLLNEDVTHNQAAVFHEIEILGAKLGKIIPLNKVLKSNLLQRFKIFFNCNFQTIIQTINFEVNKNNVTQSYFPFIQQWAIYTSGNKLLKQNNYPNAMQSIAVINFLSEENAYKEIEAIQSTLLKFNHLKSANAIFQNNNTMLDEMFYRCECLHVIAHGSLQKNSYASNIFNAKTIRKIKKMPAFLFLSVCHSNESEIISHFFSCGGRAIVTAHGLVFNHNLHSYIEYFYNKLFAGESLQTAFHAMQLKFFYDKNPNCFRFKLHGNASNLYFTS